MAAKRRSCGYVVAWLSLVFVAVFASNGAAAERNLTVYAKVAPDLGLRLQEIGTQWGNRYGVKVQVLSMDGKWDDYYDKLVTMAVAGVPFDVAWLDMDAIPFGSTGIFIDLTRFIDRDNLKGAVPKVTIEGFTVEGRIYGFPQAAFPHLNYYNIDLFDKAGLSYPTADWESDSWTWDEFVVALVRLTRDTNGDGVLDQFGAPCKMPHISLVPAFGASFIDATGGINAGEPKLMAALKRLREVRVEKHVCYRPGDANPGEFLKGRLGLEIYGVQRINKLRTANFSWNVGALPRHTQRTTEVSIDAFGISKSSQDKELAWEFIKYLTVDPEGSRLFAAQAAKGVPLTRAGQKVFIDAQRETFPDLRTDVAINSFNYAVLSPFSLTVEARELAKVLAETLEPGLEGGMALETALSELKRRGDPLLKRSM